MHLSVLEILLLVAGLGLSIGSGLVKDWIKEKLGENYPLYGGLGLLLCFLLIVLFKPADKKNEYKPDQQYEPYHPKKTIVQQEPEAIKPKWKYIYDTTKKVVFDITKEILKNKTYYLSDSSRITNTNSFGSCFVDFYFPDPYDIQPNKKRFVVGQKEVYQVPSAGFYYEITYIQPVTNRLPTYQEIATGKKLIDFDMFKGAKLRIKRTNIEITLKDSVLSTNL